MKIALITDDGATISQHFGRAPYYLVATLENEQIVKRELRDKLGHADFKDHPHVEAQPGQPHGMDPVSHQKHLQMVEAIADCKVLLCRGMGRGAYESLTRRGIQPIVTDIEAIDPALEAFIDGRIVNHADRLH